MELNKINTEPNVENLNTEEIDKTEVIRRTESQESVVIISQGKAQNVEITRKSNIVSKDPESL